MEDKLRKVKEKWREQLVPEQYRVTQENFSTSRKKGFTSVFLVKTIFLASVAKVDCGTSWPSFSETYNDEMGGSLML